MYDEINRQIRKLPNDGLKKYSHGNAVTEDEIYYFPKLINPPKVGCEMAKVFSLRYTSQTLLTIHLTSFN